MAHVNTAAEPTRQAGRQSAATPRVPVAVLVFVAMIVCLLAAMFLFPVNKIVSSLEGKVVAIDRLEQIDAYDLSLVRTLDVKVGQTVAKGSSWPPSTRPSPAPTLISSTRRSRG